MHPRRCSRYRLPSLARRDNFDFVTIADQVGAMRDIYQAGNLQLSGDGSGVGEETAHTHNHCAATTEKRGPGWIGIRGNHDITGFEFDALVWPHHDACATTNRVGPDGADREPELVHDTTIANLHGEFCTALTTAQAIGLLRNDNPELQRAQGNE